MNAIPRRGLVHIGVKVKDPLEVGILYKTTTRHAHTRLEHATYSLSRSNMGFNFNNSLARRGLSSGRRPDDNSAVGQAVAYRANSSQHNVSI